VVLVKMLFNHTDFINGFFWSRMGNMTAALSLLLFPSVRNHLTAVTKKTTSKTGFLIVVNRVLGGLAFLSILYAIRLGPVSVINALSSLQFVFIFLIIFLFRKKMSELYHHEFRHGHILHKVIAMVLIVTGFFVLFV
jgi:drug/metabolite transporter (DMT)-like permease